MPDSGHNNRPMFWRIVHRLLLANRSRLLVILLALSAGAAVTAALLDLQVDAKRRLTTEFRSFGPNVIVAPRDTSGSSSQTLDQSLVKRVPTALGGERVGILAVLYVAVDAFGPDSQTPTRVVTAGEFGHGPEITSKKSTNEIVVVFATIHKPSCYVGIRAARRLGVKAPGLLTLRNDGHEETCRVDSVRSVGGPEDDQVTVPLDLAQRLAELPGRVSVIQVGAPGNPGAINAFIADLTKRLPEAEVRPIRQFAEAEGKIYNRISGLLTATVALVLILTALCVMAAMTNVAMERKNDVGLMKAIGGATRRVLRLFLAEAAVLGLIGGAIGAAAGIALSIWLGQAVFGLAARPRMIVYPVVVGLTIIVAIAGAYPLRRLATIRPAAVFRGE